MLISVEKDNRQQNEEPFKRIIDIIKWKNPRIFFLVMQKRMYKDPAWLGFCDEIYQAGYDIIWKVLNSREITGIPVIEEQRMEIDFTYAYKDSVVYFALKFYSSDFSMKQNLYKASARLSKGRKDDNCIVLAVANIVSKEIKEVCKSEYGINIWDAKNLLWLFREFIKIENEFIVFLNYSTDIVEPEKPEPYIFGEIEKKSEDESLKEKLLQIKPGVEQYKQYEEIAKENKLYFKCSCVLHSANHTSLA